KNLQRQPVQTEFIEFFDPDNPAAKQNLEASFERFTAYAYEQLTVCDNLLLVGGLAYDRVRYPKNFRAGPVSDQEETIDRVLPKAGLVWTPAPSSTVRMAYTRSLGGASIDQSLRLEPSQVAGFNQSFRSIIPESLIGATAGARFETYNASLEQKFPTR